MCCLVAAMDVSFAGSFSMTEDACDNDIGYGRIVSEDGACCVTAGIWSQSRDICLFQNFVVKLGHFLVVVDSVKDAFSAGSADKMLKDWLDERGEYDG